MKITRIVAKASATAKALIIHSLCRATRPARVWTNPLTSATKNSVPKTPMYALSIQPLKGITSPMNRPVAPTTTPVETSALPAQRW